MMKIAGLVFDFIIKNGTAVLVIAVVLLISSSFRQCQSSLELKSEIAELQKQRAEILKSYSELAEEQRKIAADVNQKLLLLDEKYKDKQDELIEGIKSLKEEYLVDETKVIEFLVKFDIIGGSK
jgi:uncharacterized protein YoxC